MNNSLKAQLAEACGMAPIQAVRRELDKMLGDDCDKPTNALDARVWLQELTWCDGDMPEELVRDVINALTNE